MRRKNDKDTVLVLNELDASFVFVFFQFSWVFPNYQNLPTLFSVKRGQGNKQLL